MPGPLMSLGRRGSHRVELAVNIGQLADVFPAAGRDAEVTNIVVPGGP
jgi:hypothetical protein